MIIVLLHPGPTTNRHSAILVVQVPNGTEMWSPSDLSFGMEVVPHTYTCAHIHAHTHACTHRYGVDKFMNADGKECRLNEVASAVCSTFGALAAKVCMPVQTAHGLHARHIALSSCMVVDIHAQSHRLHAGA